VQANQTLGVGAALAPRRIRDDLAMSDVVNAELLRLCENFIAMDGYFDGRLGKDGVILARALKSCLQSEAPTDAEVAEIEKRHADCEGFYAGHGGYRPDWHKDRTILLAKLRATSQAEAQAPTTAGQASVAPEACVPGMWHCPKCKLILTAKFIDHATCAVGMNDEPQRCLNECGPMWRYTWKAYAEDMEARAVEQLDRAKKAEAALASTVGAPAPASTMPARDEIAREVRDWAATHFGPFEDNELDFTDHELADTILALIAKGDTP